MKDLIELLQLKEECENLLEQELNRLSDNELKQLQESGIINEISLMKGAKLLSKLGKPVEKAVSKVGSNLGVLAMSRNVLKNDRQMKNIKDLGDDISTAIRRRKSDEYINSLKQLKGELKAELKGEIRAATDLNRIKTGLVGAAGLYTAGVGVNMVSKLNSKKNELMDIWNRTHSIAAVCAKVSKNPEELAKCKKMAYSVLNISPMNQKKDEITNSIRNAKDNVITKAKEYLS